MKKLVILVSVIVALVSMSAACFGATAAEVAEAKADYKARFESLNNHTGSLTSSMVGFDIDKPGKFVSFYQDGKHYQYGTSMTPRQHYNMIKGGGKGKD